MKKLRADLKYLGEHLLPLGPEIFFLTSVTNQQLHLHKFHIKTLKNA